MHKFIVWFNEIGKDDIALVGGKGANLGEMVSFGIPVPPGFIVTSNAYFYFLEENKLRERIKKEVEKLDKNNPQSYIEISSVVKKLLLGGKMPKDLGVEIMKAYLKLGGIWGRNTLVAVRSSATAEDLPGASFAGQQITFLNVMGETNVLEKVRECWASLFEPRAIFYREEKKFDHLKLGIAVPVQKMIQSETSGVMFTCDPVTLKKNIIIIEAIYGLGEFIVQGRVTPDHYAVEKNSLEILTKAVSLQSIQYIKVGKKTQERKVQYIKQRKQKISDKQIVELARLGQKIHQHYFFPQDIEWGVEKGKIYILQTRPVTTTKEKLKTKNKQSLFSSENEKLEEETIKLPLILRGQAASPGIGSGPVRIILSAREIGKVKKGDILVTVMTSPDFVPVMKKVEGIVTDRGGQTSHAAIVSRELGVPCVVGTEKGTKVLKNEEMITVNGSKGEVYKRSFKSLRDYKGMFEALSPQTPIASARPQEIVKTATKVYVNLAEPELAAKIAKRNVDGLGLLRAEFMMAEIGIHPKKIIKERRQKLFKQMLAEKLSIFCEQFWPRPVVYRATDFKTNEYRNLKGGREFEPEEPNPLLGYRGAFRYISDPEVFELELAAIGEVRKRKKLTNLWLMIPFVRTPKELAEVKKIVVSASLTRSSTFKLWMMVEIPANVILLEDFLKVGIDGVSLGSNDLTMLLLGVDRDNSEVASAFDEENPAVLWAIERVIKTCHKFKVTSSICGQAPSEKISLVENLVKWGITSISVNPDALERTREIIHQAERKLITK